MNGGMSAIGTKRTCRVALHMSAFERKADIDQPLLTNLDYRQTSFRLSPRVVLTHR
jgi:hypothetical protein